MDRARRTRRRLIIAGIAVLALTAPVLVVASAYRQEKRNVALITAIHRKDNAAALDLINAGADPNMIDSGSRTITLMSAWHQVLDRFHGRHAAPGPPVLDLSVQANLSAVACALLDKGATGANDHILFQYVTADVINADRASLLQAAVIQRDCNLAGRLASHGADVNERGEFDRTPLYVAATNEDLPMVTLLLAHHADPNISSDRYPPPLVAALFSNVVNSALVKYLLDHGADPNGDSSRYIPLMCTHSADIVAALMAHGADARLRNQRGEAPIVYAANWYNPEIMRLLLQHGASVDDRDRSGDTPLLITAEYGRADQVESLLRRGANVNLQNAYGRTALMLATYAESLATVRFLLAHGATTTAHDLDGRTALFMAVNVGNVELIHAVIHAGSPINARDVAGETALDEAEDAGSSDGAAILRAAGARSGSSAGRMPAIGRFLGLRLGYADASDIVRRLNRWDTRPGADPNAISWVINDAALQASGFIEGGTIEKIKALDVSGSHGRLRSNAAFRQCGCGPWGDLSLGMTMAEARAALRSTLPPPMAKPSTLSWVGHAYGGSDGKSVPFTYTATLKFGNGLQGLHLDVAGPVR